MEVVLTRSRTVHSFLGESRKERLSLDSLSHLESRIIHVSLGQLKSRHAECRWSEVQQSVYHRTQSLPRWAVGRPQRRAVVLSFQPDWVQLRRESLADRR